MKIWCNLQVIINPYQDVTQTDWNLLIIKFLRKTKSTYFFLFKIKWKMGSIDSRTIQNLLDRIFLPPLTLGKTFSVCTEYSREEKQYFSAMLPLQVSLVEWVKFSLPFISGGGGGQCNIFCAINHSWPNHVHALKDKNDADQKIDIHKQENILPGI